MEDDRDDMDDDMDDNKTWVINTLRNYPRLITRIEYVAGVLGLGWCEGEGTIDLILTDFDNPDSTTICLTWEQYNHKFQDQETMVEHIPLHLLWSDECEHLDAEKRRRDKITRNAQHQRDIAEAQRQVELAQKEFETANSRAKAVLEAKQKRLRLLQEQS